MPHEFKVKKALLYYPKFCQVLFLSSRLVHHLTIFFCTGKKRWGGGRLAIGTSFRKTMRIQLQLLRDILPSLCASHGSSRCPFPTQPLIQHRKTATLQTVSSVPLKAAVHLASSTACSTNSIPRTWEVY